ncbi:phosphotransferase family protein [Jeotgalibacillus sp. ET6]|uniref:aminoglycoside phosphotransferase family protein n=1 Tax=Jeotgalibacillus sp. ET6 TaxID=3037260 RepID=UPI0024185345|nr:phosphotransferase family protein [Jeotgalibacillus sp. ET6]MDG5471445.1 phosphotransferase family protein [Jeotgalibacillus sp. ET6]
MLDLNNHASFQLMKPINKGWSSDKKYYVETRSNEKRLLRISDQKEYDQKKNEFNMMKELSKDGLPISQPIDFGLCDEGRNVYSLFTWCEGEDAETELPKLSQAKKYELGETAGRILKRIHSIPAPGQENWSTHFNRKIDKKMKSYLECGIKFEEDDKVISFIEDHRHLLEGRPQSFQHGDYHTGNMIISPEGSLSIIDFNRCDYGDPWEEFNRIVFSAAVSPTFATGQVNGYFDCKPPIEFFSLLTLYIYSNMISSIPWAIPFGEQQVAFMKNQAKEVLGWFEDPSHPVPSWYQGKDQIKL